MNVPRTHRRCEWSRSAIAILKLHLTICIKSSSSKPTSYRVRRTILPRRSRTMNEREFLPASCRVNRLDETVAHSSIGRVRYIDLPSFNPRVMSEPRFKVQGIKETSPLYGARPGRLNSDVMNIPPLQNVVNQSRKVRSLRTSEFGNKAGGSDVYGRRRPDLAVRQMTRSGRERTTSELNIHKYLPPTLLLTSHQIHTPSGEW